MTTVYIYSYFDVKVKGRQDKELRISLVLSRDFSARS